MRVFGLTGGMGSGKSTVAKRFTQRGVPVVNSDQLAREVVAIGTEGLAEVVAAFGSRVLQPSGELDRPTVARLVFHDDDARARLNGIIHPRVRGLATQRFAEMAAQDHLLACHEVPLLVEVGLAGSLRPLVVVFTSEATQIARAMRRDGSTEAQVRARLRAQLPLAQKAELADHVIDNEGSIASTLAQADEVLDAVCRACGVEPRCFPR